MLEKYRSSVFLNKLDKLLPATAWQYVPPPQDTSLKHFSWLLLLLVVPANSARRGQLKLQRIRVNWWVSGTLTHGRHIQRKNKSLHPRGIPLILGEYFYLEECKADLTIECISSNLGNISVHSAEQNAGPV